MCPTCAHRRRGVPHHPWYRHRSGDLHGGSRRPHGHKTSARGYDGYKGHVAVDPDSEIITDTQVTAGNAGDASVAADLIDDLTDGGDGRGDRGDDAGGGGGGGGPVVYGDAAYGAGEFLGHLADAGVDTRCKTQPPPGRRGRFSKDAFDIDLDDDTVTCPAWTTVGIRRNRHGDGEAAFGAARTDCALRPQCTDARDGRTVQVTRYERHLAAARRRQRHPDYRATRPKVERKIGHLMRRRPVDDEHACAAPARSTPDFNLLAAAVNLGRLAILGLRHQPTSDWTAAA